MRRATLRIALPLLLSLASCAALAQNASPAKPPASAGGDFRAPATLPYDAVATDKLWLEFDLGYRMWKDSVTTPKANDFFLNVLCAFRVVKNLEVGVATSFIDRDFDEPSYGSASGLTDTLGWAKYRIPLSANGVFSVGGFASVPTGNEDESLGTGSVDAGVFVSGGVRTAGNAFVQGHVGVRDNGNPGGFPPRGDGKTSVFAGLGGFVPAASGIEAFGSLTVETERYDGGDAYYGVQGGARWKVSREWRLQGTAGVGLSKTLPQLSLAFGAVFTP